MRYREANASRRESSDGVNGWWAKWADSGKDTRGRARRTETDWGRGTTSVVRSAPSGDLIFVLSAATSRTSYLPIIRIVNDPGIAGPNPSRLPAPAAGGGAGPRSRLIVKM